MYSYSLKFTAYQIEFRSRQNFSIETHTQNFATTRRSILSTIAKLLYPFSPPTFPAPPPATPLSKIQARIMSTYHNRPPSRDYRSAFNSRKRPASSFANPALFSAEESPANAPPSWTSVRAKELSDDTNMGFKPIPPGSSPRVGWLLNMVPTTVEEPSSSRPVQAVDLFFITDDPAGDFRATIVARPYMYVAVQADVLRETDVAIRKRFAELVVDVSSVKLEDISRPNHLAQPFNSSFLKLETRTTADLFSLRNELRPIIERNAQRKCHLADVDAFGRDTSSTGVAALSDPLHAIFDMREYDVAPVNRLAIDRKVNVGYWYRVSPGGSVGESDNATSSALANHGADSDNDVDLDPDLNASHANDLFSAHLTKLPEIVERASPAVLAFDIECTKKPLKFPNASAGDEVMMISWMLDGKGYLGINRSAVSEDIDDFEFSPHAEFHGSFEVFNERNEKALLERFFSEVRLAAPRVFATFNGDFFDWPFVETRAAIHGLDMGTEIGMHCAGDKNFETKQTKGRTALHMDVLHWVNRDSYLPQGSRGLKAVTRALLGFEPEEIPPEEMVQAAKDRPKEMATYSVSDAVCTYYLYMKYVHPFIFSLCNILPLSADDVLRKGSGTLCEMLLMCQAREKRIIAPNKYSGSAIGKLTDDGHVLETETYVGGHVEAIRTGVYRSDLPLQFNIDVETIEDLEKTIDDTLHFAIVVEGKAKLEDVTNYEEVRDEIVKQLRKLREKPSRTEKPRIYHLDVSAMYPNIILTNRLQPHAIVTPEQCAACDFNGMSECQRDMEWTWRGEFFPASRGEAEMIQRRAAKEEWEKEKARAKEAAKEAEALARANDADSRNGSKRRRGPPPKTDAEVPAAASFDNEDARKSVLFRSRLKEYCKRNYGKAHQTREVDKTGTVCQRENPFYVDTVRAFRDRRYEYKALLKKQKKAKAEAKAVGDKDAIDRADKLVVLYDSLQMAHKCILNSFYGYVMRKGARWYSMEMAGIVTNTGGLIIRRAREFIDKVGLPLELDTDGIWCVLPVSFPENFSFKTKSGKTISMSYICSLFNADVAANFSNHQYQDLVDADTFEYDVRSECSILFEVDGPYRAMVLPSSLEEGKNIKKRYAVFNDDGTLAELKGFEIKRRGELKLVKKFQGEIFDRFLNGNTLVECFAEVGKTCNKWLDVLMSKGEGMTDSEVLELLVEQNNMSKTLDEYLRAEQKSCAITCATRMQEFLGAEIVKDKGLATMYVIARKPDGDQVTARAVPVKIFEYKNEAARRRLLKKWTKSGDDNDLGLRRLLDWDYYKGRLANAILKIVSIPAALQGVDNPVPRIDYPPWLEKKVRELKDQRKQRSLTSYFSASAKGLSNITAFKSLKDSFQNTEKLNIEDIEDMPINKWTNAQIAQRRANAVVSKKERKVACQTKKHLKSGQRHLFRSKAEDPVEREEETRQHILSLLRAPHPNKKKDYAGWVRYAKGIWRAQRAARVHRYTLKRKRREGLMTEHTELVEEPVEREGMKKGEVIPFGGHSFAARFEEKTAGLKRRKTVNVESVPDYAPENFVADLHKRASSSFFKRKDVPLLGLGVVWQNVAIAPISEKPGKFNLWVLPVQKRGDVYESGVLHTIPLHLNRVLYYNSKVANPPIIQGVSCEPVTGLTLPRSQETHHLFRLELEEERFQNTDKDLSSVLTDAGAVDGVFGTRSPLEYEVLVSLGTLCAPSKSISMLSQRQLLRKGITPEDLIPQGVEKVPYLQGSGKDQTFCDLNQAFLYGSHATDKTSRAMYMVISPQAKLVHVVAVTPSGTISVNLKRVWREVIEHRKQSGESDANISADDGEGNAMSPAVSLPRDCEFYATASSTREDAWSKIQGILLKLRSASSVADRNRPTGLKTILLAQWPGLDTSTASEALFGGRGENGSSSEKLSKKRNLSAVEQCVPITRGFPVVRLASNKEDGNYMPVGWERQAVSVAFGRFADVSNWLPSQLTLSRFSGIPIGNVSPSHVHSQAIDVLVGRELMNRDHVLWSSPSAQPDLGGLEEDDSNLQNEVQSVPEVNAPGSYRTVCIDTELSNLAIATILSSSVVNQLEGTDMAFDAASGTASKGGLEGGQDGAHVSKSGASKSMAPLDEMASSAPAFRVLKDLVVMWDKAASTESMPEIANIARGLLDHVHRWTRSESSVLYDPALARFLGWLIRKMFRQLVAELRNLGANVVYASMSRVILATPKLHAVDGLRYAGFLEKTIKEKPLFRHIQFQPLVGVYAGLLFVDRFNFGALPAPEETAILNGNIQEIQGTKGGSHRMYSSSEIPHVRMVWDIARYLPIPVAVLWTQVVEEFIRRPIVQRLKEEEAEEARSAEGHREDVNQDATRSEVGQARKKRQLTPRGDGFVKEVKAFVRSVTPQLLEKIHEIREKAPTLQFPTVPSSLMLHSNGKRNCPLEFIRCLCYILSLDGGCAEELGTMKRSLLQLVGAREFSKEAQFIDPALPVTLHDVICTYCNAVVDLDVARDCRLWSGGESEEGGMNGSSWACEYCGHAYDMRQIEMDLVRGAQKVFTSYQVQDVVCGKCKLVKRENMMTHCGCSGAPFELSLKKDVLQEKLFSLKAVADFHKFTFLGETVAWMLGSVCRVR